MQKDIIKEAIINLPSLKALDKFSLTSYQICNRNKYPLLETHNLAKYSLTMHRLYSILNDFYKKSDSAISLAKNSCTMLSKAFQGSTDSLFDEDDSISRLLNKHSKMHKEVHMSRMEQSIKVLALFCKSHIELYNHVKQDYNKLYELYKLLKSSSPSINSSINKNRVLTQYLSELLSSVPSIGSDEIKISKFENAIDELSDEFLMDFVNDVNSIIENYVFLTKEYDACFQNFIKNNCIPLFEQIGGVYEFIDINKMDFALIASGGGISTISEEFDIIDFNILNEENTENDSANLKEFKDKKLYSINLLHDIITTSLKGEEIKRSHILELINSVGKINTEKNEIDPENYFFTGSTGDVGALELVRSNAPNVSLDDIIGISFDEMKEHLLDLTNYSQHSNLYITTSPRKKIKSNMLAIGPYGCGKTEIARAIAADERFAGIEISVSDLLTAYFGEFEKNVDRLWDQAVKIRKDTGKMVFIIMDEFDSFFGGKGQFENNHSRVQKIIQAKLDGMTDYEGIIVIGMTNEPKNIPLAILRRFKYVDVVGQLTVDERVTLLKKFITRGLPLSTGFKASDWKKWGVLLEGVTGDIIGKIADDIHYEYMSSLIKEHPDKSLKFEELATNVRLGKNSLADLKKELKKYKKVNSKWINDIITQKLAEPVIQEQIKLATKLYKDADTILNNMHKNDAAI